MEEEVLLRKRGSLFLYNGLPVCAWRERSFAFNPARTFSESSGSMPHHPARQTIVPIPFRLRAA